MNKVVVVLWCCLLAGFFGILWYIGSHSAVDHAGALDEEKALKMIEEAEERMTQSILSQPGTIGIDELAELDPGELREDVRVFYCQQLGWRSGESDGVVDEQLKQLRQLPNVEEVLLGNNPLTDPCLGYIAGLRKIVVLGLDGTQITGVGFAHLAELHNLESLSLGVTSVVDEGLATLPLLPKLTDLSLWETDIGGAGLEWVGQLPLLHTLDLVDTNIESSDLEALVGCQNLQILFLAGTKIDDAAGDHIARIPDLRTLRVDGTEVGDAFIEAIAGHPTLNTLDIEGTNVTLRSKSILDAMPALRTVWSSIEELNRNDNGPIYD